MPKIILAKAEKIIPSSVPADLYITRNMPGIRKQQYLLGRGLIRAQVSGYLNCQPNQLAIEPTGKPMVTEPSFAHVSLAHSNNFFLCGVSEQKIGVDLEYIKRKSNMIAVANRFYHKSELAWLKNDNQLALKLWVAKEACIKCDNVTIAGNLANYVFDSNFNLLSSDLTIQFWQVSDYMIACASNEKAELDFLI